MSSLIITPAIAYLPKSADVTFSANKNKELQQANKIKDYFKDFQVSGALGVSWLSANQGGFVFNPTGTIEVDDIVTKRATRQLNTKIGIGYNLFANKLAQNKMLSNLLIELNFYNFSGSAYGKVERYDNPYSHNIAFTLDIKSNKRLMVDIKPSLFTYHGFSPYMVFGAGIGWIEKAYSEVNANNPGNPVRVISPLSTNKKLVLEGGGGINYAFNRHLGCYLEYLFTRFGKISADNATYTNHTATPVEIYSINSPTFTNMYTNAVLFGFYIKI